MQIVIEMPEEKYKWIKENNPKADKNSIVGAIVYGTPLPKGHGELVDISPYKGKVICSHLYSGVIKIIEVNSIEPIIEADKAESEN